MFHVKHCGKSIKRVFIGLKKWKYTILRSKKKYKTMFHVKHCVKLNILIELNCAIIMLETGQSWKTAAITTSYNVRFFSGDYNE